MPDFCAFTNLVERPAFAELFLRCPPLDIPARLDHTGLPVFHTNFDLLTTLEDKSLARLKALPLFKKWSRLLRFPTCFAGYAQSGRARTGKNSQRRHSEFISKLWFASCPHPQRKDPGRPRLFPLQTRIPAQPPWPWRPAPAFPRG